MPLGRTTTGRCRPTRNRPPGPAAPGALVRATARLIEALNCFWGIDPVAEIAHPGTPAKPGVKLDGLPRGIGSRLGASVEAAPAVGLGGVCSGSKVLGALLRPPFFGGPAFSAE